MKLKRINVFVLYRGLNMANYLQMHPLASGAKPMIHVTHEIKSKEPRKSTRE